MDVEEELQIAATTRVIPNEVAQIVKRVLNGCEKECKENKVAFPLTCYMDRATFYTGIRRSEMEEMLNKDPIFTNQDKNELSLKEKIAIRQVIALAYVDQKKECSYVTYETIRARLFNHGVKKAAQLNLIGYNYVKTKIGEIFLMENPKITFDRMLCLQKIQKATEKGQQIYYLSVELLNKNAASFDKLYFFYLISKNGYENGIVSCDETFEGYLKWLAHILAPSLKTSSLIVVTNTPLELQKSSKHITRYHSKNDMIRWLSDNNIPCISTMSKAELFKLIEASQHRTKCWDCENILKANGHEVLILSDDLRDLSLADTVWKSLNLSHILLDINKLNVFVKQKQIKSAFDCIDKSMFNVYNTELKAIQMEFLRLDKEIEDLLDSYVFESE